MRVRRPPTLLLTALTLLAALLFSACSTAPPPEGAAAAAAAPAHTEAAVEPAAETTDETKPAEAGLFYAEGSREVAFQPKLSADSYIAIDADSGRVLIARRDRQRRPIASLTKIMTALLVVEAGELGRKVRVPPEATRVEPNREGLKAGRRYERRLLLYSALMVSANDSAVTLAYDAGNGSVSRFFRMMNARARELGMTDTTYKSASGLNDETNLSSARDQAILSRAALESTVFARIVRTRYKLVEWPPPTYAKEWVNHNKMLFSDIGAYGIKTGYTTRAGACLAVAVHRQGRSVIAVVLGSKNIWADMPRLVDAAFERIDAA